MFRRVTFPEKVRHSEWAVCDTAKERGEEKTETSVPSILLFTELRDLKPRNLNPLTLCQEPKSKNFHSGT